MSKITPHVTTYQFAPDRKSILVKSESESENGGHSEVVVTMTPQEYADLERITNHLASDVQIADGNPMTLKDLKAAIQTAFIKAKLVNVTPSRFEKETTNYDFILRAAQDHQIEEPLVLADALSTAMVQSTRVGAEMGWADDIGMRASNPVDPRRRL